MKEVDYRTLCAEAESLIAGVKHPIANLSNLSALIFHELGEVNWAGFYFVEGDRLVLGPFQGRVACIEIPMGRGVCGTAAARDETQIVPDVDLFEGHIACSSLSRSEIVVPVNDTEGKTVAVLDIDSTALAAFDETDKQGLEEICRIVGEKFIRN